MNGGNRQCIFCPNKADSQEHIWSEWILNILPPNADGKLSRLMADGSIKSWPTQKPELTLGKVCAKDCNNGWMSAKLETPMKAATESIILNNRSKTFSSSELTTISAWAFKTAVLANHMDLKGEPFFSFEQRRAFARNLTLPKGVQVWIAQRNAGHVSARWMSTKRVKQPILPIAPHLKVLPISPYRFEMYDCIFSIGYLLLQVTATRWTERQIANLLDFPPIRQAEFFDSYAVPIWPMTKGFAMKWPPPHSLGNFLFEKFCTRFEHMEILPWMSR